MLHTYFLHQFHDFRNPLILDFIAVIFFFVFKFSADQVDKFLLSFKSFEVIFREGRLLLL